jgi:hypothetical protein
MMHTSLTIVVPSSAETVRGAAAATPDAENPASLSKSLRRIVMLPYLHAR